MRCQNCGSRDIDFQESSGQSVCVNCGSVLEENTLTASIEFQESGDRAHVVGQFVSANCSKPYMSGAGNRMGDGRDMSLINARKVISQVASSLRLPSIFVDRAYRLYQLAIQKNLIMRRRQSNMVAACLYSICRQEKSPHLLIDFSDSLQINVFVLGKAFMQFSQVLNLKLPIVDPSLYIHRYASRLEFGEKLDSIVTTALRIITRLKKDWIFTGRRPDGICAVALLIAARAHKIFLQTCTVADLFRITVDTINHRMEEFRATPAAQLTLAQFNCNEVDIEFDPPSFIRHKVDEFYIYNNSGDVENKECRTTAGYVDLALPICPTLKVSDDDEENFEQPENENVEERVALPHTRSALVTSSSQFVAESEDSLLEDLFGPDMTHPPELTPQVMEQMVSTATETPAAQVIVRASDGTLRRKMNIGDIQVTVPLPCLQKKRRVSAKGRIKQLQKQKVYEHIYHEVYSAQDTHAIAAEKNKASNADSQDAEEKENPIGDDKKKDALLTEAQETCGGVIPDCYSSYKKPRKDKAVANSKYSLTAAVSLDGTVRQTGVIDLTASVQPIKAAVTEGADVTEEVEEAEVVMDDEELDTYILNSEEQQKRSLIWEKQFRSFLDDRERRQKDRELANAVSEEDMYTQGGKMKKKYAKRLKKATSTGGDSMSAAQAAMQYVGQMAKPSSRKINYEALKGVFNDDGSFAAPDPTASANGSVASQQHSSSGLGLAKLKSLGVKAISSTSTTVVAVKSAPPSTATAVGKAVEVVDDEAYEEYEEDDEVVGHIMGAGNDYEYYDDDEYY